MKKKLYSLIHSSVIYYIVAALILWGTCDPLKARLNRLNYLKDAASYPVHYMDGNASFDKRQLYYARYYYENLLRLIPFYEKQGVLNAAVTLSRALAMIGICQFYLGHYPQAIAYMEKAARQEPRQFWFQYDLGLMYFKMGHDGQALDQARDLLSFSKEKLEASMQLDYYELWPPAIAAEYRKLTLQKYYLFLVQSYKLSILATDHQLDAGAVRTFALSAIKNGLANDDKFFYYYAGLAQEKPSQDVLLNFVFPPSVYFVPIGQEKLVIMKR